MLTQAAEGVLVHQSGLLRNNTVVVQGRAGALLIDPGTTGDEDWLPGVYEWQRQQLAP